MVRAVWCSIGRLLKLSGVSVTSIKIDPYLVRHTFTSLSSFRVLRLLGHDC